ncbi:MAG: VOC family protein [Rhodobacteraceae bacterium]|nr:VOC family protein [Paracoccaceae bacterium]
MPCSMSAAVLGVSNMESALQFYRDLLGLDASAEFLCRDDSFNRHWNLPVGTETRARLLSNGDSPVGRLLLMEFQTEQRTAVPPPNARTYRGFWNLNFYIDDLEALAKNLRAHGIRLVDEIKNYNTDALSGGWLETVALAPDEISIALFQLVAERGTTVGDVQEGVKPMVKTKRGSTQVATTSHCVSDFGKAKAFYETVLGMKALCDDVTDSVDLNRLNARPDNGRTRWGLMQGDNFLGKVMISHPLNYSVPERVLLAAPPNIGYLAQSFEVDDLDATAKACKEVEADVFSPPLIMEYPGLGPRRTMVVRNPGSQGLTELVQKVAVTKPQAINPHAVAAE